jgi:putative ABC transport system permease protein
VVAGLLIVAGAACLALANQSHSALIIAGALAMALGILFISPLAIRALGALGGRAPVAIRLALRDLSRHQARSGAALAAISLAVGITAAIIISAAADKAAANAGNLPDTQIVAWLGQPEAADSLVPIRTPAQLGTLAAAVHQIARSLHHAAVITLDMPVNPADKPEPGSQSGQAGQPVAELGAPQNPAISGRGGTYRSIPLYVATPAVLHYLGISPATINPATDILTTEAGQLVLSSNTTFATAAHVQRIQSPGYTSEPTTLMTLAGLHRKHWTQIQAGWLIKSSQPVTVTQLAAAREVAAKAGLTIEARNTQASLATISAAATAAGALLALGVLAMTVGLIRTEAAGDLRTLTATGATSTTRRTLTATTVGALALLGALTGTAGAYLALAAGHRSDPAALGHVPVLYLAITTLGVPAAAALTGWILAGRQPPAIARRVLE